LDQVWGGLFRWVYPIKPIGFWGYVPQVSQLWSVLYLVPRTVAILWRLAQMNIDFEASWEMG